MKKNQVKIGVLLSYFQTAVNIIINLIYMPLMLKSLGDSEFGLYSTVSSTISMLSMLNLGFGNGYIRFYSKYKAEKKEEEISKLNGLFLIIFLIIGAVALVCGLFLVGNMRILFDEGLTTEEYDIAKTLMFLLVINLSISFPMTVFFSIVTAHERFIVLKLLQMAKTVLGPLVTIPLLMIGYGSIAIVIVTLGVSLVADTICLIYCFAILKQKFVFRNFDKDIFKNLFSYTVFIALNIIIDQINWNIDKLILARFKGTEEVAVYTVGANLQHYYQIFSVAISGIFTPRIHRIVNEYKYDIKKRNNVLSSLFIRVGRIQYLILALVCSGMVFFGKEFIYFWVGAGHERSYYVALLLIIPVTVPLIQNIGIEIQRAENKHRFRSVVYSIMAIANFGMTWFFAQKWGAIGATLGTCISLILANIIIINIYYHNVIGIDIKSFWKQILRISIALPIPCCAGIAIKHFINCGDSVLILIGCIGLYTAVYLLSVWFIGMNKAEKELVIFFAKKVGSGLHKLIFGSRKR